MYSFSNIFVYIFIIYHPKYIYIQVFQIDHNDYSSIYLIIMERVLLCVLVCIYIYACVCGPKELKISKGGSSGPNNHISIYFFNL